MQFKCDNPECDKKLVNQFSSLCDNCIEQAGLKDFTLRGVYRISDTDDIEHGTFKVLCTEVSDGYHTMEEVYDHRMALNVLLFKMMYKLDAQVRGETLATHTPLVMKAKFHNDGTMFEGGYFVVYAHTIHGDISYHYKLEHWDKFDIPEKERVPWAYDGHTPEDTIERLLKS